MNKTMNSDQFINLVKALVMPGRRLKLRNEFSLGGVDGDVYVNFINLPEGIGSAGGGAEAENNRISFWIKGWPKNKADGPRTGKVKIECANSVFRREVFPMMRAKTATPEKIAVYLAEYLNKLMAEIEPNYTHTKV